MSCAVVFHLARKADRHLDGAVAEILAEAGDEDFAHQDGDGGDQVEAVEIAGPGEGDQQGADQQLVGDRVEHLAERGVELHLAGEEAVEPVGDGGGDVEQQREPAQPVPAAGDEQADHRDRRDAGEGQLVGKRRSVARGFA